MAAPTRTAVVDEKGGTGKTSTVVNLAAALARRGRRQLVIGLDRNCTATRHLGVTPGQSGHPDVLDVLLGNASITEAATETSEPGVLVVPERRELNDVVVHLADKPGRELRLRAALETSAPDVDDIWFDCPGDTSLLTLNALAAARDVLCPLSAGGMEAGELAQLAETVAQVRAYLNPQLELRHILLCMFDSRRRLDQDIQQLIAGRFADQLLTTTIPSSIRIREAYTNGVAAITYDPTSTASIAYLAAGDELLERMASHAAA